VSGDRQSSGRAGLEAQRRAIAAAYRGQRWQLLELVEEIARTAEEAKRPGIAEPLRLLEAADKQALVAAKRDGSRACCSASPAWSQPRSNRAGRWPPSTAPPSRTISPYAIDRIRRERTAGNSLAAIANGLNADRVPTAQGGRRWYPATISEPPPSTPTSERYNYRRRHGSLSHQPPATRLNNLVGNYT
jgi:hypothetical protein